MRVQILDVSLRRNGAKIGFVFIALNLKVVIRLISGNQLRPESFSRVRATAIISLACF